MSVDLNWQAWFTGNDLTDLSSYSRENLTKAVNEIRELRSRLERRGKELEWPGFAVVSGDTLCRVMEHEVDARTACRHHNWQITSPTQAATVIPVAITPI